MNNINMALIAHPSWYEIVWFIMFVRVFGYVHQSWRLLVATMLKYWFYLMCLIVLIALFPPPGLLSGRSGRPCWANLASLGSNVGLSCRILEDLGEYVNLSCGLLVAMFTHLVGFCGNVVKGPTCLWVFDSFVALFPPLGLLLIGSWKPKLIILESLGGNVGLFWKFLEGLGGYVHLFCGPLVAM